jgi:dTDP-4-dehydrorhamnose 3,5-epimerase
MTEPAGIEGVRLFPLQRFDDERGWFVELARASALPKPPAQANLSFSRKGVIRGLHYHERAQNDLFVCLRGTARVVVLDRQSGHALSFDVGTENEVAVYCPGHHAHGYEALTDALMLYLVTEEYNSDDPDEHVVPWNDGRVRHLWSTQSPILSERDAAAAASS